MVKADDSNLGLLTSKALTLMLQGRVYEEMRVRRAARKCALFSACHSQGSNSSSLAAMSLCSVEEVCEEEVANCLDHSGCDVASEVDWSRDSDSEVETDAGAGFRLASYFHLGFGCAGHIYDNSTLMEADLSVCVFSA